MRRPAETRRYRQTCRFRSRCPGSVAPVGVTSSLSRFGYRQCDPLLERMERGEIDPTRVITHRLPLGETPHGSDIFKNKQERCEKVVLKP